MIYITKLITLSRKITSYVESENELMAIKFAKLMSNLDNCIAEVYAVEISTEGMRAVMKECGERSAEFIYLWVEKRILVWSAPNA